MIKGFEGYYPPDFDKLWNEATFVFDTNVLLDLYRSSLMFRNEMLDILESLKGRIWIPHQFFFEYHKNKVTIYENIESDYATWEKSLQDCREKTISKLQNELGQIKNRTGFEINPRIQQVDRNFEEFLSELSQFKEQHLCSLNSEPIEEKIAELFAERYGNPFEDSCLENIRILAKERFESSMPPGSSKDNKKDKSDLDGDLIGWLQTIKYANDEKKPIILVSNDGDWFLKHKGKTKGPYPALLQEMYDKAKVSCYIYKSSQFIKFAQEYLEAQVSNETIEEAENREKYFAEQESAMELSETASMADIGAFTSNLQRIHDALPKHSPELQRTLAVLTNPNSQLQRTLDELMNRNPELQRTLAVLTNRNPELQRTLAVLTNPNSQLQRMLDVLTKPSSEK